MDEIELQTRGRMLYLLASTLAGIVLVLSVKPVLTDAGQTGGFTDVTHDAGIRRSAGTSGLAWGDCDGDGFLDLFVTRGLGRPSLYRNSGDGTFIDLLDGSGIGPEGDRKDSAWADYDEDGDLDLHIAQGLVRSGFNQLYQNDGHTHFVDVAEQAGVTGDAMPSRGASWADYDNDGDLDLFVANAVYESASDILFSNNGNSTFSDVSIEANLAQILDSVGEAWTDYDGDGDADLYVYGKSGRLYRNEDGSFADVTSQAGVRTDDGAAAIWGDYDNDGDPDLYVSSGYGSGVRDYVERESDRIAFAGTVGLGDEDGLDFVTSSDVTVTFHLQRFINQPEQDPVIVFLGPDGDHPPANPFALRDAISEPPPYVPGEDEGLFVWQSAPGEWHIRWTAPGPLTIFSGLITASLPIDHLTEISFDRQPAGRYVNHLFRNDENGAFSDVTAAAGLTCTVDSRGAAWGDYDNDGDLDLFLVMAGDLSGNAPDRLYQNNGDGTFVDVHSLVGIAGTDRGLGWAARWADYDNDGALDLFVQNTSTVWPFPPGGHQLFHNQGNDRHWLELDLRGSVSNRDSLGARVWVTAGGVTQFREKHDGSSHYSHYNGPLHVGLGSSAVAEQVVIQWPSGITRVLTDVQACQLLTVPEVPPVPASDFFVAPDGSDTFDCSSPESACRTIQRAIDVSAEGDVIKVAAGVYTDGRTAQAGHVIVLTKTVALRGGYDPAFANPPDPVANASVLDAQGLGRAIYIAAGTESDIEGLRVIGGSASGLGGGREDEDAGGGVYAISATVTIRNSWLSGNVAEIGGGAFLRDSAATFGGNTVVSNSASIGGGGLFLVASDASLSGNSVISNSSAYGGGVLLQTSSATLSGNTLLSNTADQLGGGLFLEGCEAALSGNRLAFNGSGVGGGGLFLTTSDATLTRNTVTTNTASVGAGIQIVESVVTLTKNLIGGNGNAATERGGGIFLGSSGDATLNGNTVINNKAGAGGGLFLRASAATIDGNIISDNIAGRRGGGLYLREESNAELSNSIVADNQAEIGGSGLYVAGSSPRLRHNTIVRNGRGQGSGVLLDEDLLGSTSSVTLTNNILVSHTVGIYVTGGSTATMVSTLWGSDGWANDSPFAGPGVIVTTANHEGDPAFVDPQAGNYHIGSDSAAVDVGVYAGITVDIDREARPVGKGYDIGADEVRFPIRCYLPMILRGYAHWRAGAQGLPNGTP